MKFGWSDDGEEMASWGEGLTRAFLDHRYPHLIYTCGDSLHDRSDWRWQRVPDFTFPCPCGSHRAVLEVTSMLGDTGYLSGWLKAHGRFDWYEHNAAWVLLQFLPGLTRPAILRKLAVIDALMANGARELHRVLATGEAARLVTATRALVEQEYLRAA